MQTCRHCQSANLDQASACSVCGAQLDDFTIAPLPQTAQPGTTPPSGMQPPGAPLPGTQHPGPMPPQADRSGYASPQGLIGPPPSGPPLSGPGQAPPPHYPPPSQYPGASTQPGFQGATIYAPPGTPGGYVQTSPTNNLAITSLVLSIVGTLSIFLCFFLAVLAPAGAITGHVALKRIKTSGQSGRGLALAGVIVGWIGTLGAAAMAVLFAVLIGYSGTSGY